MTTLKYLARSPSGPLARKTPTRELIHRAITFQTFIPSAIEATARTDLSNGWGWILIWHADNAFVRHDIDGGRPVHWSGGTATYGAVHTGSYNGYSRASASDFETASQTESDYHYTDGSGWDSYPAWAPPACTADWHLSCAVSASSGSPRATVSLVSSSSYPETFATLYDGPLPSLPDTLTLSGVSFHVLRRQSWQTP